MKSMYTQNHAIKIEPVQFICSQRFFHIWLYCFFQNRFGKVIGIWPTLFKDLVNPLTSFYIYYIKKIIFVNLSKFIDSTKKIPGKNTHAGKSSILASIMSFSLCNAEAFAILRFRSL
jgi:hypothetical protein